MSSIFHVPATRPGPAETEKVTVNLGFVELGHIDLSVRERFHSTRTDLIRTAIRSQLSAQSDGARQVVSHQLRVLGR